LKIYISREVCYRNIPWEYPWDIRGYSEEMRFKSVEVHDASSSLKSSSQV